MDVALIKDFGFPVACVVALALFVYRKSEKTDNKVDVMETFMREELSSMVREAHVRERDYVAIIKDARKDGSIPEPHHAPPLSHEDSTTLLQSVRERANRPLEQRVKR